MIASIWDPIIRYLTKELTGKDPGKTIKGFES